MDHCPAFNCARTAATHTVHRCKQAGSCQIMQQRVGDLWRPRGNERRSRKIGGKSPESARGANSTSEAAPSSAGCNGCPTSSQLMSITCAGTNRHT
eukprot:5918113-Pleurochrysis_carterae.AAC.1